jgi:3-methyladenine DNA glycosylase AlkC
MPSPDKERGRPASAPSGRKGAGRPADVPAEVLSRLNAGTLQTATLAEGLAVDFVALMGHVAPELADEAAARLDPADGITKRMATAGGLLLAAWGPEGFDRVQGHPSDTARGWAAYLIAAIPELRLSERLRLIRPLADDGHFGVREWAWLALRPHVAADIRRAIAALTGWVGEPSPNLRRFAVEATRPRGVWCAHIAELKHDPGLGLPLLEPVRADPARYVQDSAANWLNDAAKSRPDWVRTTCERWRAESDAAETARICARALRRLGG